MCTMQIVSDRLCQRAPTQGLQLCNSDTRLDAQNEAAVLHLEQEEFRHEEDEFSQSSEESSLGLALDEAVE